MGRKTVVMRVGDITDAQNAKLTPSTVRVVDCIKWKDAPILSTNPGHVRIYNAIVNKAAEINRKCELSALDGKSILVHCYAGVNRSCACLMAWYMIYRGNTLTRAAKTVKQIRPRGNCGRSNTFWNLLVLLSDALKNNRKNFNEVLWFNQLFS